MTKKAIYTDVNGRKTFLGKHINDTIIRDFPFAKAVLWQDKELSFDKRLLAYAQLKSIKYFIMSDSKNKISLKFGIRAISNNGTPKNHGQGEQWYFPKDIGKKIKYKKTPYVKEEQYV